jgi:hypothetical protein
VGRTSSADDDTKAAVAFEIAFPSLLAEACLKSADNASVAALEAAFSNGFLAEEAGLETWQRTSVVLRLKQRLREEQWTIDALLQTHHLAPEELAETIARIAWKWYGARQLGEDADCPSSRCKLTAAALRESRDRVRRVRELLRDLHPQVARRWDERIRASLRWCTEDQARELAALETIDNAIVGLGPEASEEEMRSRLGEVSASVPLAHDAHLFAANVLARVDGTALTQVGVVALCALEETLLASRGLLVTKPGRRRLLDLERDLGRTLVDFLQDRTDKPLWGHAAALLIAACPSRTLVGWRDKSLTAARLAIPTMVRDTRPHWSSNHLPPGARSVYREALGNYLRREVR